jgi:hypothetical protein
MPISEMFLHSAKDNTYKPLNPPLDRFKNNGFFIASNYSFFDIYKESISSNI